MWNVEITLTRHSLVARVQGFYWAFAWGRAAVLEAEAVARGATE